MNFVPTSLPDVLLIVPPIFEDDRGFFLESWNERTFRQAGLDVCFRQDNHSRSARNVLRGLHYQLTQPQGKLVRCVSGAIFDVAVDLRRSSASFGKWVGVELSETNRHMLWIPPGFGHGFLVLSAQADVLYKTTDFFSAESDCAVLWSDPEIGIDWPLDGPPILSRKDADGRRLADAELFS